MPPARARGSPLEREGAGGFAGRACAAVCSSAAARVDTAIVTSKAESENAPDLDALLIVAELADVTGEDYRHSVSLFERLLGGRSGSPCQFL
jgi:hypothetical protein